MTSPIFPSSPNAESPGSYTWTQEDEEMFNKLNSLGELQPPFLPPSETSAPEVPPNVHRAQEGFLNLECREHGINSIVPFFSLPNRWEIRLTSQIKALSAYHDIVDGLAIRDKGSLPIFGTIATPTNASIFADLIPFLEYYRINKHSFTPDGRDDFLRLLGWMCTYYGPYMYPGRGDRPIEFEIQPKEGQNDFPFAGTFSLTSQNLLAIYGLQYDKGSKNVLLLENETHPHLHIHIHIQRPEIIRERHLTYSVQYNLHPPESREHLSEHTRFTLGGSFKHWRPCVRERINICFNKWKANPSEENTALLKAAIWEAYHPLRTFWKRGENNYIHRMVFGNELTDLFAEIETRLRQPIELFVQDAAAMQELDLAGDPLQMLPGPANIEPAASSHPIPAKTIAPHLRRLSSLLERHYQDRIPHLFRNQLVEQRGRWSIFVPPELEESFFKPFNDFLLMPASLANQEAALEAVKEALRFFAFRRTETANPDAIQALVDQNETAPYDHPPLCDFSATEIQQSLLTLKLREFSIMAENYAQLCEQDAAQPKTLPCFLLTQDKQLARLQILQGHFNDRGFLEGVGEDEDDLATRFLEELFGSGIVQQEQDSGKAAALSLQQLQALERASKGSDPLSRLPAALLIVRLDPAAPQEETAKKAKPASERAPAAPERENRKRKRGVEILEKQGRSRPEAAGKRAESIRGIEDRKALRYNHPFQPIEDEAEAPVGRSQKESSNTGKLPIIPASLMTGADELSTPIVGLDNFWKELNVQSSKQLTEKLSREQIKEAALEDLRGLNYPIWSKLQEPDSSLSQYRPWGRLLKPYQIDAAKELLRHSSKGLSKLLSLEPGLGKTYVFGEYLAQLISRAESPEVHLVAAPESLLIQNKEALSRFLSEASTTAWQLSGKKWGRIRESREVMGLYYRLFNHTWNWKTHSLEELSRFLRIIAYFPIPDSYKPSHTSETYQALIRNPRIAEEALALLQTHVEANPCEQEIASLCREFNLPATIDSSAELIPFLRTRLEVESESIYPFYRLIGRILDLGLGRPPLESNSHPDNELEKMRDLGISDQKDWIQTCKTVRERDKIFETCTARGNEPRALVLITTPNSLPKLGETAMRFPVGSLVIDEASRIHTPKSDGSKNVQDAIQQFGLHSKPHNPVVFVTGTPFENNFDELWNLLAICNKDQLFPNQTLNTLKSVLLNESKKYLTDANNGTESDPEILTRSFAHFMHFRQIIRQLVHYLKSDDPQVLRDWKDRFPTVVYENIEHVLSDPIFERVNSGEGSRKLIASNRRIERILIHPSMENASMSREKSSEWPILEMLRGGSAKEKNEWIEGSSYLTAILTSEVFREAMRANEHVVVVGSHLALAEAFRLGMRHKYRGVLTGVFNGDLEQSEKQKAVRDFETAPKDKPAVLFLMIKSGGVGLNLPSADRLILTTTSFNPGVEEQAVRRVVRANNVGIKYINRITFPQTYYSAHAAAIQDIKRKWKDFLWKETSSDEECLDLWCEAMKAETYRSYLNQLNSGILEMDEDVTLLAQEQNQLPETLLTAWKNGLTQESLTEYLEKTKPRQPRASVPAAREPGRSPLQPETISLPARQPGTLPPLPLPQARTLPPLPLPPPRTLPPLPLPARVQAATPSRVLPPLPLPSNLPRRPMQ